MAVQDYYTAYKSKQQWPSTLMIAMIDGEWLTHNPPMLLDSAAEAAGLELQRGTENFLAVLEEMGTPDMVKRGLFKGVFDGCYKLVRYFGLDSYHPPQSVEELLETNDLALDETLMVDLHQYIDA